MTMNMNIEGIKIIAQKRNNTYGYATTGMLLNYFGGSSIDEDYLLEKDPFNEKGITFMELLEIYKKYLKGYDASLIREDKESTLEIIKQSLRENLSLQALYLTDNVLGNNEPVLHYAVLTKYDEKKMPSLLPTHMVFARRLAKMNFSMLYRLETSSCRNLSKKPCRAMP